MGRRKRLPSNGARRLKLIPQIGGGTGYNIEAMRQFIDVPTYFSRIYLVDFSPSLCRIARQRFSKLGWKNVHVVCQDARLFRLQDHEAAISDSPRLASNTRAKKDNISKASLVTMSYALSMIPEFHSVIDSIPALLAPSGILSVVDFYVQNAVDISGRNYGGGSFHRHVNWLGRVFWRSWFELDRVALEPARRDYLEYRFGTILNFNKRHYYLGAIPYYTWIGCPTASETAKGQVGSPGMRVMEWLDATSNQPMVAAAGLLNPFLSLPLPSAFYQNHSSRLHYDEHHQQHTQFQNEYIYAFTWEDPKLDKELLNITPDDSILAITSAGDNILSYALCKPRRIHAVDLNPAQNHLLELKMAAFASLTCQDTWKLFGLGKHPNFRTLLLEQMSPHLSSQAFQFWIANASTFTSRSGCGLYETGGSRHAVRLAKYLFALAGLQSEVQRICNCETIKEQRAIWHNSLRWILLNRILHWAVIRHSAFLWRALGVPPAQRDMILHDYLCKMGSKDPTSAAYGQAIWDYMMDTLDPVVDHSLLKDENYFYSLCLSGKYTKRFRILLVDEILHR
jgi:betaine lipid synthase